MRVWTAGVLVAGLCAGCGGDVPEATPPAEAPAAEATVAPSVQSVGAVSFAVDGRVVSLDYLPEGDNNYTPLASSIRAMTSADGTEQLAVTFLSIDLKSLEYPADLPLPRVAGQTNPLAAMANVGFSYTDADGREWAGPGRIHVESFGADGVIVGAFTEVRLPHTDDTLPDVVLSDGHVRARITAPW